MRRSLGDALKNVFEETTMKNMPIDQFQSFKNLEAREGTCKV